jgi:hypothetical protein
MELLAIIIHLLLRVKRLFFLRSDAGEKTDEARNGNEDSQGILLFETPIISVDDVSLNRFETAKTS